MNSSRRYDFVEIKNISIKENMDYVLPIFSSKETHIRQKAKAERSRSTNITKVPNFRSPTFPEKEARTVFIYGFDT